MQMCDIAAQLKSRDIEITDVFLVQLILNSLPSHFGPFKITYNTQKEKCSTIHIANTMQGFLNQRKPSPGGQLVFPGNRIGSHVEAIRTYRVILSTGFVLILNRLFMFQVFPET
ncbi:Retrovirus-related Pol polyprotein from transposon TNT 1-94 [Senna tora]|uniref:Retrovirus-related Pol polyprotein from transposon TNT 1-94 n=1 Tax=Senna tora TaxID=362788 RepID=A0A835CFS5_9FABA|nr:Retrovirus-related Pol polyprotein from transposon TNT 1-94 [Senna tora]